MIELSFEEFGKYRKANGHIDLSKVITEQTTSEREVRGNDKRDKDWFDIKDGRVMFKANTCEQPYAHYSELICCELAKQAGLETAQYDFAEYAGQIGIVTKDVCKKGEELLTINELIGHGPTNPEYPDSTDIYFVFDTLEEKLLSDGYSDEMVDKCILQLRKQLLFDIYVMETDRHTENLSYIISRDIETGEPNIHLAPAYDTEAALALCEDGELMDKISSDFIKTANVTNMQEPKLCVIPEAEDSQEGFEIKGLFEQLQAQVGSSYATESEQIWKTTLDFLIEDRRAYEYLEDTLSSMDIQKAIEALEESKKCRVPESVRNMAIASFEDRKNAIAYELGLDIEYGTKKEFGVEELT